jgi:hypothetical protein
MSQDLKKFFYAEKVLREKMNIMLSVIPNTDLRTELLNKNEFNLAIIELRGINYFSGLRMLMASEYFRKKRFYSFWISIITSIKKILDKPRKALRKKMLLF